MISRIRVALVGSVAVLALLLTGGVAMAQDPPAPTVDGVQGAISALVCADVDTGVADIRADITALLDLTAPPAGADGLTDQLDDKITALDCDADEPTTTTPPPTPGTDEFDCSDFSSQASAQAQFVRDQPGDPNKLDPDGNGVACDGFNFGGPSTTTNNDTRTNNNSTTVNQAPRNSVIDLDDDDSVADTDGTQITEVPEGSVDTGAAW